MSVGEKMKIVVTGATGFIGRYFLQTAKNTHDLTVLSNQKKLPMSELFENLKLVNYQNSSELINAINCSDALVHLAAIRPHKYGSSSYADYQQNIQLLDSLISKRENKNRYKLVNVSSKAVYGSVSDEVIRETDPTRPETYYGLSKSMSEELSNFYARQLKMTCINLRFSQVIGWGEQNRNVFSVSLDNAMRGRPQSIWGEGRGRRSYIYAKDAVDAIVCALHSPDSDTYNICWRDSYSHLQVAQHVNEVFQNKQINFLQDKPEDTSCEQISPLKAKNKLNWEPRYSNMKSALMDMLADQKSNVRELLLG